jgi:hypothetical protein
MVRIGAKFSIDYDTITRVSRKYFNSGALLMQINLSTPSVLGFVWRGCCRCWSSDRLGKSTACHAIILAAGHPEVVERAAKAALRQAHMSKRLARSTEARWIRSPGTIRR